MKIEKTLPFLILATVALSGLLLGMGQGDFEPFVVAVVGASAAFLVVDWLKWFQVPQWLANLLAIIVTIITVSNFYFTNDSVRHLLGVGKLLVYLQTILMFQRKSARVYWQVLVLSLLQIVVGAVFNLGFEGGVLFIIYMMVAGLTMMMLHLYQDRQLIRTRNDEYLEFSRDSKRPADGRPMAVGSNTEVPRGVLRRMIGSFGVFSFGALLFSVLLFYFLPRDHSSWSGPQEVPMQSTGFDKRVDMDHSEMILLSGRLVMNVRYWYPDRKKSFQPNSQPYLRGVALSNIKIEGNKTRWVPPPYQMISSDFRPIFSGRNDRLWVIQEIVLEPTEDPLMYSVIPPRLASDEELVSDFEWCWPLGGLTRQRTSDKITVSHFRYNLKIPILDNGDFHSAYRYVPRDGPVALTKEQDPGNHKWLTYLDRQRYPTIVQTGQQLAESVSDENHLSIAQLMESWFLSDRFSYSLDFRNVNRNENLDCVEDFFANFRSGHCEYYASSLALMLRSQGIPARLVVGYRGGDINEFGGHLDVEDKHAHAWVEAYIRPRDCSAELIRTGQASSSRGCWLRLDPTPAVDLNDSLTSSDDALDFAKSLWRDYVLGLQSESQSRAMSAGRLKMAGLFRFLDLDWWQNSAGRFTDKLKQAGGWKTYAIPGLIVILAVGLTIWYRQRNARFADQTTVAGGNRSRVGWWRTRVGNALKSISPGIGNWFLGRAVSAEVEVPFYSRAVLALENAGFERSINQTQREFAADVAEKTASVDSSGDIGLLTHGITDFYYRVRFGHTDLNADQRSKVDHWVNRLEKHLAEQRIGLRELTADL